MVAQSGVITIIWNQKIELGAEMHSQNLAKKHFMLLNYGHGYSYFTFSIGLALTKTRKIINGVKPNPNKEYSY